MSDFYTELDRRAARIGATDWRHSVVDLLKIMGRDSSLCARRLLASRLGYRFPRNYHPVSIYPLDTYDMNVWLHNQLMQEVQARQLNGDNP